ncbi:serine hydrolase [Butyrivibrio sp. FCS014]|uniref:serine hydrolase n=1 Tax=Butyrivibrio sp. FCS014 TaxID=1408304 RepID=UPI000464AD23|nr:serine hydrolase [Butyrivibrio sp. FCS014]
MLQKKYRKYRYIPGSISGVLAAALILTAVTGCGRAVEEENAPLVKEEAATTDKEAVTPDKEAAASGKEIESQDSRQDTPEDIQALSDYADSLLTEIDSFPKGSFQAERSFPDQAGYVDNTLAMNSMYSFEGYSGQGVLYFEVSSDTQSFDLFVNNRQIDTADIAPGNYELDICKVAKNGTNTVQVSNVTPDDATVTVKIPYPTVIDAAPEDAGMSDKPLELIDRIIQADVDNGFSSAQLAVVKDGKLVYRNAWGLANSYDEDGNRLTEGAPVTNDTLYDLASNTKMYSVVYAIQYLADREKLSLDTKVTDILGSGFADDAIEIDFAAFEGNYPGLDTIKAWKSSITVKNLLMHQAGFPDSGHYHNDKYDTVNQELRLDVDNILYVEGSGREKTYKEGICRTPLMYKPGTRTLYSDIDYMTLGLIIEKVTGEDLNTFLKETFWDPMGLSHITYCPLDNGFTADDCAATEVGGNTRSGLVTFPGIRTNTIQGEVHDEESFYRMEGISGHAGLFANATDLAKLASVMLTGGYGSNFFFSKNTRDLFISPQAGGLINYGIGWWREADDKRVWYFGTQAPESTVGHQGFTGTFTMIDFENNLVMVYLTNSINTPIYNATSLENANQFCGKYYTSGTIGFVPQILYMGMGDDSDLDSALSSLVQEMIRDKQRLVDKEEKTNGPLSDDHPLKRALKAIQEGGS